MSRPSTYTDAKRKQAEDYLAGGYADHGDVIPSVAGLAHFLGVSRECLYEWARQYPRFSDTLRLLQAAQERETLNRGLVGDFNATLCKLILANHGYGERVAQEHSGPGGATMPTRVEIVPGPDPRRSEGDDVTAAKEG